VIRISDQDGEAIRRNTFTNFTRDVQWLNYLKMCSLKVRKSFNSYFIDEILLGESQHAQFVLADNVDMDVTEITAALGCKFVYFTELQISF
jgi:hypothetical protein